MSVRTLEHPITGQEYRLGRVQPERPQSRKLSLRGYLAKSTLPEPPATFDYARLAHPALSRVYRNDVEGCCTIAAAAHIEGVFTANATGGDEQFIVANKDIDGAYHVCGGFVLGDPATDNGCQLSDVLRIWRDRGLWGRKIRGSVSIDATDFHEVVTALWLFENLYFGVGLPNAWISPMPAGPNFVWGVAGPSVPGNGHCFAGNGRKTEGVTINTWGMQGIINEAAIAMYAAAASGGELYAVVSANSLNRATAKAPSGFDWEQLVADASAINATT